MQYVPAMPRLRGRPDRAPEAGTERRGLRRIRLTWMVLLAAVVVSSSAAAVTRDQVPADLTSLSLEDLMDIEITTVSKKAERLLDAPAAVFVITQDDIRRSGAKTIPDLLRMVPGVQVGQIDSNKWAVSSRGFNGRFANKLLVLIDGRSVYTPLFSGVFWDIQDTVLTDVERIEVVRGPGATLWGANAVNGVINIITKPTQNTTGGVVTAGGGSEEQGFAAFRYGASAGERTSYRIYAKYFDRDATEEYPSGDAGDDDWHVGRAGFRLDWDSGVRDQVMTTAEIYSGDVGETLSRFAASPARVTMASTETDISGGHWVVDWSRTLGEESSFGVKAYYDHSKRDDPLYGETRDNAEVEFQHRFPLGRRNDVIWGVGFRYTSDDLDSSETILFDPSDRSDELYNAFFQNEITLVDKRLFLTVGSKVEHNDYTGLEIQPNVRLLWSALEAHSFWWSISRSVRTPSRADHDGEIRGLFGFLEVGDPQNPLPVPLVTSVRGNRDLDAEEVVAYEFGYRTQITADLTLDTAFFYNDYDDLSGVALRGSRCEPAGTPVATDPFCFLTADFVAVPLVQENSSEGHTKGAELSLDWRPMPRWRLQSSYTYLDIDLRSEITTPGPDEFSMEGWNPEHAVSVRSMLDLPGSTELDLWLRYVDELPGFAISSYWTLDTRFGWHIRKDLTLDVVGRNLLDHEHREFDSELGDIPPAQIERSGYAQIRWSF